MAKEDFIEGIKNLKDKFYEAFESTLNYFMRMNL